MEAAVVMAPPRESALVAVVREVDEGVASQRLDEDVGGPLEKAEEFLENFPRRLAVSRQRRCRCSAGLHLQRLKKTGGVKFYMHF